MISLATAALVLALPATAQAPLTEAEAAAAKRLYMTKTCIACHGRDGKKSIQDYPDIAGQRADYMIAQIEDILDGKRTGGPDSTGNPRAKGMRGALIDPNGNRRITSDEVSAIARWLASLEPRRNDPPTTALAPDRRQAAQKLYAEQCEACHGANGREGQEGFPAIAGQKRAYVLAQMQDIKSKARSNGQSEAMLTVVADLSDEQIALLADYVAELDPAAK